MIANDQLCCTLYPTLIASTPMEIPSQVLRAHGKQYEPASIELCKFVNLRKDFQDRHALFKNFPLVARHNSSLLFASALPVSGEFDPQFGLLSEFTFQ